MLRCSGRGPLTATPLLQGNHIVKVEGVTSRWGKATAVGSVLKMVETLEADMA